MIIKLTKQEYDWLGRRLSRLTEALRGRNKEQVKLIKETAAKFNGERLADDSGLYPVGIQRRHLRLLQEIQKMSVKAIEEGTLKEIENRASSGKGEPGYYKQKQQEALALLADVKALLTKLESYL